MEESLDIIAKEEKKVSELENEETEEALESEASEEDNENFIDETDAEDEEFLEAKERGTRKEKKFEDEDIVEERFYTIPLRKVWIAPRKKRAPKAARLVKSYVLKHMKIRTEVFDEEEEPEQLVIDNEVNERLWSRGIEKPPRKIKVRVVKNKEGVVTVLLAEGD